MKFKRQNPYRVLLLQLMLCGICISSPVVAAIDGEIAKYLKNSPLPEGASEVIVEVEPGDSLSGILNRKGLTVNLLPALLKDEEVVKYLSKIEIGQLFSIVQTKGGDFLELTTIARGRRISVERVKNKFVVSSLATPEPILLALERRRKAKTAAATISQVVEVATAEEFETQAVASGVKTEGDPTVAPIAAQSSSATENQSEQAVEPESEQQTDEQAHQSNQDVSAQPKGPGSFEVDEQAATRALERSLIRSDALLLASGQLELAMEFSYQFDEFVSPVLLDFEAEGENAAFTGLGQQRSSIENLDISFDLTAGLPGDTQIGISIPLASRNANFSTGFEGNELDSVSDNANGAGDVVVSVLKTLVREKGRRPDVIARLSVDADTGSTESDGTTLGTGGTEYTVGLAATKRQDPMVFNYGFNHTIANTVDAIRVGDATQLYASLYLAASPYTSLSLGFTQTFIDETEVDGAAINGSDRKLGSMSIGFSSTIGQRWFLSGSLSTGLNESASDYVLSLGISRRASF